MAFPSILATLGLFAAALVVQPAGAQPMPAVIVAPATVSPVALSARFTGRAVAPQRVEMRARVTGFIEAIDFVEGEPVEAGTVLYQIEDDSYRASLAEAEASVAAAEAAVALAQIERDRQATLLQREVVAQAELDRAEALLASDTAEKERREAVRDLAALDLSYTEVIAPFDGLVGLTQVDVGALVGPETGALTLLVANDPMRVEFPVPERGLLAYQRSLEGGSDVRIGQARLTLSDGTTYPEPGDIDFADITVSQGTDTVTLRAVFPNPDGIIRDGALIRVQLEATEPQMALTIPQQALQRDLGGHFVMVVDDSDTVEMRRIELERQIDRVAVIASGLEEGERVIIEGVNKVRPGVTVDAAVAGDG